MGRLKRFLVSQSRTLAGLVSLALGAAGYGMLVYSGEGALPQKAMEGAGFVLVGIAASLLIVNLLVEPLLRLGDQKRALHSLRRLYVSTENMVGRGEEFVRRAFESDARIVAMVESGPITTNSLAQHIQGKGQVRSLPAAAFLRRFRLFMDGLRETRAEAIADLRQALSHLAEKDYAALDALSARERSTHSNLAMHLDPEKERDLTSKKNRPSNVLVKVVMLVEVWQQMNDEANAIVKRLSGRSP